MITREIDYAIRAILYLSTQEPTRKTTTAELAQQMDIPYRFLRRILLRLVEEELVISTRGKQGGLRLARRPETISLLDVVTAIDVHSVTLNSCLLDPAECTRTELCVVHRALESVQETINTAFRGLLFADLARQAQQQDCGATPERTP